MELITQVFGQIADEAIHFRFLEILALLTAGRALWLALKAEKRLDDLEKGGGSKKGGAFGGNLVGKPGKRL